MSEAFACDCQVNVWMDKTSLLVAEKEPVNEEEITEAVAREGTNVNVGHSNSGQKFLNAPDRAIGVAIAIVLAKPLIARADVMFKRAALN